MRNDRSVRDSRVAFLVILMFPLAGCSPSRGELANRYQAAHPAMQECFLDAGVDPQPIGHCVALEGDGQRWCTEALNLTADQKTAVKRCVLHAEEADQYARGQQAPSVHYFSIGGGPNPAPRLRTTCTSYGNQTICQ